MAEPTVYLPLTLTGYGSIHYGFPGSTQIFDTYLYLVPGTGTSTGTYQYSRDGKNVCSNFNVFVFRYKGINQNLSRLASREIIASSVSRFDVVGACRAIVTRRVRESYL